MDEPVRFDTKVAVVLRDDLATWQLLNVTAFLVSGIAGTLPEVIGEPYEDADGTTYLPMIRQPILVYQADAASISQSHQRALGRGLALSVYTEELFKTGHDGDNRAAVRAVAGADLNLVGIGVYGPKNSVDKAIKGSHLHP